MPRLLQRRGFVHFKGGCKAYVNEPNRRAFVTARSPHKASHYRNAGIPAEPGAGGCRFSLLHSSETVEAKSPPHRGKACRSDPASGFHREGCRAILEFQAEPP